MHDEIAYLLLWNWRGICKPACRSWETLQLEMLEAVKAPLSLAWGSAHVSLLLLFSSALLCFFCSAPHVGLCFSVGVVMFTLMEVAEEEEQQARALFKHGTCGRTPAHLCGNIGEALIRVKTENEDEKQSVGKPVQCLPRWPCVCANTRWPLQLYINAIILQKRSVRFHFFFLSFRWFKKCATSHLTPKFFLCYFFIFFFFCNVEV